MGAKKGSRDKTWDSEEEGSLPPTEMLMMKGMMINNVTGADIAWASSWVEHIAPTAAYSVEN
jgi:hypothetical protein